MFPWNDELLVRLKRIKEAPSRVYEDISAYMIYPWNIQG